MFSTKHFIAKTIIKIIMEYLRKSLNEVQSQLNKNEHFFKTTRDFADECKRNRWSSSSENKYCNIRRGLESYKHCKKRKRNANIVGWIQERLIKICRMTIKYERWRNVLFMHVWEKVSIGPQWWLELILPWFTREWNI